MINKQIPLPFNLSFDSIVEEVHFELTIEPNNDKRESPDTDITDKEDVSLDDLNADIFKCLEINSPKSLDILNVIIHHLKFKKPQKNFVIKSDHETISKISHSDIHNALHLVHPYDTKTETLYHLIIKSFKIESYSEAKDIYNLIDDQIHILSKRIKNEYEQTKLWSALTLMSKNSDFKYLAALQFESLEKIADITNKDCKDLIKNLFFTAKDFNEETFEETYLNALIIEAKKVLSQKKKIFEDEVIDNNQILLVNKTEISPLDSRDHTMNSLTPSSRTNLIVNQTIDMDDCDSLSDDSCIDFSDSSAVLSSKKPIFNYSIFNHHLSQCLDEIKNELDSLDISIFKKHLYSIIDEFRQSLQNRLQINPPWTLNVNSKTFPDEANIFNRITTLYKNFQTALEVNLLLHLKATLEDFFDACNPYRLNGTHISLAVVNHEQKLHEFSDKFTRIFNILSLKTSGVSPKNINSFSQLILQEIKKTLLELELYKKTTQFSLFPQNYINEISNINEHDITAMLIYSKIKPIFNFPIFKHQISQRLDEIINELDSLDLSIFKIRLYSIIDEFKKMLHDKLEINTPWSLNINSEMFPNEAEIFDRINTLFNDYQFRLHPIISITEFLNQIHHDKNNSRISKIATELTLKDSTLKQTSKKLIHLFEYFNSF